MFNSKKIIKDKSIGQTQLKVSPKKAQLAARLPAYGEQAGINKNCKIIKLLN
jgi:hypothetical protein